MFCHSNDRIFNRLISVPVFFLNIFKNEFREIFIKLSKLSLGHSTQI